MMFLTTLVVLLVVIIIMLFTIKLPVWIIVTAGLLTGLAVGGICAEFLIKDHPK